MPDPGRACPGGDRADRHTTLGKEVMSDDQQGWHPIATEDVDLEA
ncbi:MAG TPA: hypothetical protein VF043_16540 [Ktedonobacteraceae bacterium]